MKTAKELLFEKHAAAEAKLNQFHSPSPPQPKVQRINWNLSALAALWITIAFLRGTTPDLDLPQTANTQQPQLNPIASIELRRAEIFQLLDSLDESPTLEPLKSAYIHRPTCLV